MLNFIIWIVVGAIIGWLASIITGRNRQQGLLMNIVVGIIGAFLGGVGYSLVTGRRAEHHECGHHQPGWFPGGPGRRSGAAGDRQLDQPQLALVTCGPAG